MKTLLRMLAFLGAIAFYHPPVAHADEISPVSDALTSEITDSQSLLFYNPETGNIVRVDADGALIDVDPSTVQIKALNPQALASDDSESLVRRYHHRYHHRYHYRYGHRYHHRYYRRYYYGYNDYGGARAFGMFLGGLFYSAVSPCGPINYNPWYCWY